MKPIKLTDAQMDAALGLRDAGINEVTRMQGFPLHGDADELRRIVRVMDNTAEWALDGYSVAELIRMFTAHAACDWDYYPDQWTQDQRDAAARLGVVPTFDDNGVPTEVDRELTHVEKTLLGALK